MALLINLLASKLTRVCVSRLVRVPGGGVGQGVGVWNWMLLTLSVKDNRKKNKVSAKFKSRPREILLGNFLATCTILSYFFDSEQLFGEWATLKVSKFLAYFHYFKITFTHNWYFETFSLEIHKKFHWKISCVLIGWLSYVDRFQIWMSQMWLQFHNGWVSCDNSPNMVQQYVH